MNKIKNWFGVLLVGVIATLSGCSAAHKLLIVGDDGVPLSSYAILVTSPNVISLPAGKTITISATLQGNLFGGVDYNTVSITSSRPDVATVSINKNTSPYQILFKAVSPGKTFITVRFDNNPDTDISMEATVFEFSSVASVTTEIRDGGVKLEWQIPSGNPGTQIQIYRNTSPTFSAEHRIDDGKVDITTTMLVDSQLTNDTTYYYKIMLLDADGFASSSTIVTVTPKALPTGDGGNNVPTDNPLNSIPDNTPNTPTPNETPSGNVTPSDNVTPSETLRLVIT